MSRFCEVVADKTWRTRGTWESVDTGRCKRNYENIINFPGRRDRYLVPIRNMVLFIELISVPRYAREKSKSGIFHVMLIEINKHSFVIKRS